MASTRRDIRMIDRQRRMYGTTRTPSAADETLPDLSGSVAQPSSDELEKLRADLVSEAEVRSARIVRFIAEGPLKPVPRAVIPVSENDL